MSVANSLETLFNNMENFITSKTVVGEIINIGGVIILPLVDVAFGVGAGGGDTSPDDKKEVAKNSSGGGGLGAKITPSAVIVVVDGNVQLINLKNQDGISKIIDMAPSVISKLNLGAIFGKDEKNNSKNVNKDINGTNEVEIKKTEAHFVEDGEDVVVKTETISEVEKTEMTDEES